MQNHIYLTPSLFIYLGTSPSEVGWRLKQQIEHSYGDVPIFRHLWIDVNANIERPEVARWFSAIERVELAGFTADEVLANLDAYPTIRAWWPRDSRLRPGYVRDGAGQMRPVGRLAFFRMYNDRHNGPSPMDKLEDATTALTLIENANKTEAKSTSTRRFTVERNAVRVYIIANPGGASGSGIVWDVAHKVRHLLRGSNPTLISIGVMPPVIDAAIKNETHAQREKIRANTYAWFKESDYLRRHPHWRVQYPEGAPVDHHAPPFDLQFVIDMANQAGDRLSAADDVHTMIANAIFLDTGSALGGAIRGFNANVSVLHSEFQGRRRSYSSFASASLVYPAPRIQAYCGAQLGERMVRHGLLVQPTPAVVTDLAAALLGRLGLRDDRVLSVLLANSRFSVEHEVTMRSAKSVETVRTLLTDQEKRDEQSRRQHTQKVQKAAGALRAELAAALESSLVQIALQRGIPTARAVLEALTAENDSDGLVAETTLSLLGIKSRLHQQGVSEADLAQAQREYDAAHLRLQALGKGLWQGVRRNLHNKGWRNDFGQARTDCLYWRGEINRRSLQLVAQRAAAELYDHLVEKARAAMRTLARLQQSGERQTTALAAEAKAHLKPATAADGIYELTLEAVDSEYIAHYFQQHAAELATPEGATGAYEVAIRPLDFTTLPALEAWVEQSLGGHMRTHATRYFTDNLANTSLLQALADAYGHEAPAHIEAMFDRLVRYCHPFWQYNRDSGIQGQEGKSVIGVEDEHSALIPARYRNNLQFELTSTGFKHRIDVLRIQHGLPAFLLRGMDDYKTYYHAKRKGLDPLHILPEVAMAEDLEPELKQEARATFAEADAFGYIVQVGSWYYFDPSREVAKSNVRPGRDCRLEQGREKAEESFVSRDDMVRMADELIEHEVVTMGNRSAIELLDKHIERHRETIAKMSLDNELRRQFEKEIAALQAKQRKLGRLTPDLTRLAA